MGYYIYKISIIIPLYNVEKYIADCLDSILNSDLPKDDYEVIVINDGSIDNGPEMAQTYASRFPHFVYLSQENQGQSVARNYGIREAKGEYIWCVDSDDRVDSSINKVYQELKSYEDLDIIAFQLKIVTEQNESLRLECTQPSVTHGLLMSGRDAIVSGYNPSSVCALWVRRQMFVDNNLFFKEGIAHQDVELSYRLFAHAKNVIFTDYVPYIYILHPNSTSQSVNPKKKIKYLKDDIVVHQSFMCLSELFATDAQLSETIANRAKDVIFGLAYSLWVHRKEWIPLGINGAVVGAMKEKGVYPLRGPFDSWKKRVFCRLMNIEVFLCNRF